MFFKVLKYSECTASLWKRLQNGKKVSNNHEWWPAYGQSFALMRTQIIELPQVKHGLLFCASLIGDFMENIFI